MRNVLLSVKEPSERAMIPNFIATLGEVYEEQGEILEPDAFADDFIVQTGMYLPAPYAYRAWYSGSARDGHIAGLLVDVNQTYDQKRPVVSVIEKSAVEPLVVGEEAVLGGLSLGVVSRIVKRNKNMQLMERGDGVMARADVRQKLGLTYEPHFTEIDKILSRAVGETTTLYKVTAEAQRKHVRV